jgi:hypothetical protein
MGPEVGICVVLPIRVVSEANQREHWAKKASRAKAQRSIVRLAVGAHLRSRSLHGSALAPVVVSFTRIGPRKLDMDNLAGSFKHVQDGVCDALGIDDGDEARIRFRYGQERRHDRDSDKYGVRILIERF